MVAKRFGKLCMYERMPCYLCLINLSHFQLFVPLIKKPRRVVSPMGKLREKEDSKLYLRMREILRKAMEDPDVLVWCREASVSPISKQGEASPPVRNIPLETTNSRQHARRHPLRVQDFRGGGSSNPHCGYAGMLRSSISSLQSTQIDQHSHGSSTASPNTTC